MKKLLLFLLASMAWGQDITPSAINKIFYVNDSFRWSQTDVAGSIGNLSVAGSNTLTLAPCPVGIDVSNTAIRPYSVYISTVGTPEAAKVTGGTCTPRAATGTIIVTTLQTHAAGFTVGTAYAGIQEALNDAANLYPGGLTQNQRIVVPPTGWQTGGLQDRAYNIYAPIYFQQYNTTLDLNGALLNCHTTSRCLAVGDLTNANTKSGLTVSGGWFTSSVSSAGFAITNAACVANVASITATGNTFAVGDVIDIQMMGNTNLWGPHTVTGAGDTFTFTGCSALASTPDVGFVNYLNTAIEDSTNHAVLDNQFFIVAQGIAGKFSNFITVDNDQAAVISHMNVQGQVIQCSATYCGSAIYAPGPFSVNASVIYVSDSQLSLQCAGNGITNYAGNTLSVTNVVTQGFQQWAVMNGTNRGGFGGATISNMYNEVGSCSNPVYPGSGVAQRAEAGIMAQGADTTVRGGEAPIGNMPQFAATGATQYNYCIVIRDSVFGPSPCLPVGFAVTNGAGSITVAWPRVAGNNTVTYDLLRYPGSGNAIVAPYTAGCGGGSTTTCGSIATAIAQCSTVICSTTDTAASATSAYTVAQPTYFPQLNFWPGGWIGSPAGSTNNAANASGMLFADNISFVTNLSPLISMAGNMHPTVFTARCDGTNAGVWSSCPGGNSNGNSTPQVGSLMLQNGADTGGSVSNVKGRLNFMVNKGASVPSMHIITLVDSAPDKTIATSNHRPANDTTDSYIGIDSGAVGITATSVSIGSPVAISEYIANVGDGTNWKRRLTGTVDTLHVPLNAFPSDNTKIPITSQCGTGAAAGQSCFSVLDQGGGSVVVAKNDGSVTIGGGTTKSLSSGVAANSDMVGELTFTAATTSSTYSFTGTYTSHPECTFAPQFDIGAHRLWWSTITTATIQLTSDSAQTGNVSYICVGRD